MQSRSLMLSKCKVSLHTKAILEAELQLYSCSGALEITFSETLQLRGNRVRSNSTHRSELMVLSPQSARNYHPKPAPPLGNKYWQSILHTGFLQQMQCSFLHLLLFPCRSKQVFYFRVDFLFLCVFFLF